MKKIMMIAVALLCAITTQAYTITVAEQQNCTVAVSPQQESYEGGEAITVTITPAAGAVFESFEVYCECTEAEWWETQSYSARRRTLAPRRARAFAYRAELCWFADDWEEVTKGSTYTFTMPARNVEIEAIYIAGNATYAITKTAATNGSTLIYVGEEPVGVASDAATATLGTTVNIRTTPNNGYSVDEVKVFEREEVGGSIYESLVDVAKADNQHYSFTMPANPVRVVATYRVTPTALTLYDDADNSQAIGKDDGLTLDVTLSGRTLWKDGSWNTLCLPFDVDAFEGSPLENASVMELDVAGWYDGSNARHNSDNGGYHQTGFDAETGTLYLYFLTVNKIETGKPYIIRWTKPNGYVAYDGSNASTCSDIVDPVFTASTIKASSTETVTSADSKLAFKGIYDPVTLAANDKTKLYLGTGNNLYYPSGAMSINAFRAYFQLNDGLTAGDVNNSNVRMFFGNDSEQTGIENVQCSMFNVQSNNAWHSLDGRKLSGKPTAKGIYIYNGVKRVIK